MIASADRHLLHDSHAPADDRLGMHDDAVRMRQVYVERQPALNVAVEQHAHEAADQRDVPPAEEQQDPGCGRIAGLLDRQVESLGRATRECRRDGALGLRDDAIERLVGVEHDDVLVTAQEPSILAALARRLFFAQLTIARLQRLRRNVEHEPQLRSRHPA